MNNILSPFIFLFAPDSTASGGIIKGGVEADVIVEYWPIFRIWGGKYVRLIFVS
jgi:hypothetical protein